MEVPYALSIGAKINDLGWPWTADTHSVAEKMRILEPTTKIWQKIHPYYQQQKCRTMTLASGGIRFMRILVEVPRAGASNDSGLLKTAIFRVFDGYFSDTLEMRPALLYGYMQSVVGFWVIPECMTLNDLERLFRVKFCFHTGLPGWDRATSRNNCVEINKDGHILSAV